MKHTFTALAAIGVFSIAPLALAAQASIITLKTSGTISSGLDNNHLFGAGGALDGQAFSMSLSVDTRTLNSRYTSPHAISLLNAINSGAMHGEVLIANHTYAWNVRDAGTALDLVRVYSAIGSGNDVASITGSGTNSADGWAVRAGSSVYALATGFLASIDPEQNTDFSAYLRTSGISSYADFGAATPNGSSTFFTSSTPLLEAVWSASPVPEPAQYGMLIAGALALLVRRRQAWHIRPRRPD